MVNSLLGATKVNGATGEEEVFEAPIVSYFGDEAKSEVSNANNGIFDDLVVKNAITVEGGVNQNRTSQFYGPVAFGAKVTVSSEEGLETSVLKIKGESAQPKEITVGIQTPTVGKRVGDISLKAQPEAGEYLGHIFTGGDWRRFGVISKEKDLNSYRMDKLGIGQTGQGSIFDGTDAVEVNGTVKIQNLYVGGVLPSLQTRHLRVYLTKLLKLEMRLHSQLHMLVMTTMLSRQKMPMLLHSLLILRLLVLQ